MTMQAMQESNNVVRTGRRRRQPPSSWVNRTALEEGILPYYSLLHTTAALRMGTPASILAEYR